MKVSVTQAHINQGKKMDCLGCPIALALMDVFPNKTVSVGLNAHVYHHDTVDRYVLSKAARNFINHFDFNEPVEPFEFTLGKPTSEKL